MGKATKVVVAAGLVFVAVAGYVAISTVQHGFSAREKPSRLEEFLARHARKIATPANTKQLRNPFPATPESVQAARAHWMDHCASCHALDGSGNTTLGKNLYPKAPDLRDRTTQGLSDGELYYIITNGVRFTGMPAWGGEHSTEETWQLVSFIRRLPTLTAEDLKQMEHAADEQPVPRSGRPRIHEHAPGSKAHSHRE